MYADPSHIRKNRVNLSLNDAEQQLILSAAKVAGVQPSTYMRELVIDALIRHEQQFAQEQRELRRTHS